MFYIKDMVYYDDEAKLSEKEIMIHSEPVNNCIKCIKTNGTAIFIPLDDAFDLGLSMSDYKYALDAKQKIVSIVQLKIQKFQDPSKVYLKSLEKFNKPKQGFFGNLFRKKSDNVQVEEEPLVDVLDIAKGYNNLSQREKDKFDLKLFISLYNKIYKAASQKGIEINHLANKKIFTNIDKLMNQRQEALNKSINSDYWTGYYDGHSNKSLKENMNEEYMYGYKIGTKDFMYGVLEKEQDEQKEENDDKDRE